MSMYVEWKLEIRVSAGVVCSLAGTVATSAEVGTGVAEALVTRPEGLGVHPHKARKRIEGGARSREDGTGVCRVSYYKQEGQGQGFGGRGCNGLGLEQRRGKGLP